MCTCTFTVRSLLILTVFLVKRGEKEGEGREYQLIRDRGTDGERGEGQVTSSKCGNVHLTAGSNAQPSHFLHTVSRKGNLR